MVLRRYRFAVRPGWLALHVLTVALIVTMVLLGRWQLDVSESKHFNIRNFGYALQWWAFSTFVAIMWARIMRDQARHSEDAATDSQPQPATINDEPVTYRRYVMPQLSSTPEPGMDETQAAYNDYLARLAAEDTGIPRTAGNTEETTR